MLGSRNFHQGGGGSEKNSDNVFRHQLFYSFTEGYQWFILRKTIYFKVPEGAQHFTGEGVPIFPRGGGGRGTNVNIELVNIQGGGGSGPLDPRMRMIDPLASSVKPIPKDRFSHAMAHFSLLERLVPLQNMIRYMVLDISSGSTLYFI